MKRFLGCLAALLIAMTLAAEERGVLLETQREYVAELLALGRPEMAQLHLDIIRDVFPGELETIRFYQAKISFAQEDYRSANQNFASVLEQEPAPMRRIEVLRRLVEGHLRLKLHDQALEYLEALEPRGGKDAWYAETLRELAEATHQHLANQPARKRATAKTKIHERLKLFQKTFPDDPGIPWIQFHLAEVAYDQLITSFYEKGKISDERVPIVIDRKDDDLVIQLHQTRRLFNEIKQKWPDHRVINRVDPRLLYLDQLIARTVDASGN